MTWHRPPDPEALEALLSSAAAGGRRLLPTGAAPPTEGAPPETGRRTMLELLEAEGVEAVSTAAFREVRELEPADLTVTVGAGVRLPDLRRRLDREGLWLPPASTGLVLSAGGLAAAAPPGPFDARYGGVRRHLLACRLVSHGGTGARWGRPVMKNVAGYDVRSLVCGGFDRTGVLHEVTFRLWPRPPLRRRFRLRPDGPPETLLGEMVALQFDREVRADGAVWRWRPRRGGGREGAAEPGGGKDVPGPGGGKPPARPAGAFHVWLVGSDASVAEREERLRAWARERETEVEGRDGMSGGGGKGEGEGDLTPDGSAKDGAGRDRGGDADGAEGGARAVDPYESVVVLRPERGRLAEVAGRLRRGAVSGLTRLEALPGTGHLRCAYRRPGPGPERLRELLREAGLESVRVERGSADELRFASSTRPEEARRLEERVVAALEGRPRHWLAPYL